MNQANPFGVQFKMPSPYDPPPPTAAPFSFRGRFTMKRLNQHPLNQTALRRLAQAKEQTKRDLMHVLTLTHIGNVEIFGSEGAIVVVWDVLRYRGKITKQKKALMHLTQVFEPYDISHRSLEELADMIVGTLNHGWVK